ncbi:MAG: PQQ-binding-like beta-propeller repeat protein [Kiritimatiellae bacterium]|nr:PQQ-binding-like beta-propeller repeat protein [Kiritimatiellia bacterium]
MTTRCPLPVRTMLLTILMLACRFSLAENWPSWRMDSTLCGFTKSSVPAKPRLLWRTHVGHPIENPPVAMNGRTFLTTSGGTVVCVDLQGKLLWKRAFTNDAGRPINFASSAICHSNAVYACSDDGDLHALEAKTGQIYWSTKLEATVFSPPEQVTTTMGTHLFIIDQTSGSLHCIQAKNGKLAWSSEGGMRTDGPISIAGDRIVFGSCDSMAHMVSRTNGKPISTIELGEGHEIASGIALKANRGFTGNRSGSLVCVDMQKRQRLWTYSNASGHLFSTPAVSADRVVALTGNGNIICLDQTDGTELWSIAAEASEQSSPVIAGNQVLICLDGVLSIIRLADGAETWKQSISDTITPPAITDGMIIIGTDEGEVMAFGKPEKP